MRIYLDHAATTPVDERVLDAMKPYFIQEFGNASSIHSFGQEAQSAVDHARTTIANYLHTDSKEIIFTSGATESSNLAILGLFTKWKNEKKLHFITSKIEHPSVLEVLKKIKDWGHEVSLIEVDQNGIVNLKKLKEAIKANTVLVSIMYANNEVGAIQPIAEIGKIVSKEKNNRKNSKLPIYFHVDAVQAVNYLDMDVPALGCDLLSISGHKIYAPKGIGALYVKKGVNLAPLVYGGHHEYNLRPGTLNVPGIVGLARAIELVKLEKDKNIKLVKKLKEKFIKEMETVKDVRFNGKSELQLPHIINLSFKKAEGESILMMLDLEGIAISTGSACSSGALEPSHVLTAMGVPVEWTHGSVRISLGKHNTESEIKIVAKALKAIVERLRKMAPDIK